jgi:hypothetical protein
MAKKLHFPFEFEKYHLDKDILYVPRFNPETDEDDDLFLKENQIFQDFQRVYQCSICSLGTNTRTVFRNHETGVLYSDIVCPGETYVEHNLIFDYLEECKNFEKILKRISRLGIFFEPSKKELINEIKEFFLRKKKEKEDVISDVRDKFKNFGLENLIEERRITGKNCCRPEIISFTPIPEAGEISKKSIMENYN